MNPDWETKKLSEICLIRPPKSEARKRLNGSDLVSFVPMADLETDQKMLNLNKVKPFEKVVKGYTYFADEDVLLAKITPCFENGKLGIARNLENGVGFGSSEYIVFRPYKTLDNEFLYYFLSRDRFREEGGLRMRGAVGHKRVDKEFIENYEIPVPPIEEQRRIVAVLDEALAGVQQVISHTERNLQNAQDLFDFYLQSIFAEIYEQHEVVKMSDLSTEITDGDHSPPPKSQTGIPFITISNINKETRQIDFSDTFMVPEEYYQNLKDKRKPARGDLLYTVTGSFGIPVVVDFDKKFCFQRHIGLIRPTSETNTKWLYYLILSPQLSKQASERATGTAQKTVSLKVLRNFDVPKVPPNGQRAIVAQLDDLAAETQRLQAIYEQKLTALHELKQSILQQAFSGQLRLDQSESPPLLVTRNQIGLISTREAA